LLSAVAGRRCHIDLGIGLSRHKSQDGLSSISVWNSDDGRFAYTGKGVKHILHLTGPYLEAGCGNHVLLAVDPIEPTRFVEEADVASVHPAAL
jgi:hypothetical protein